MATPDVRVRFSAEGAQQVVGQINSVQKAAQQAQRRLSQASAALGVGFGVAAFVGIIKGSIDAGSALAGFAEKAKIGAKAASDMASVGGGYSFKGGDQAESQTWVKAK